MLVAFIKKQKNQLISTQLEIVPQGSVSAGTMLFCAGACLSYPLPLSSLFSFTFHISNPFWLLFKLKMFVRSSNYEICSLRSWQSC